MEEVRRVRRVRTGRWSHSGRVSAYLGGHSRHHVPAEQLVLAAGDARVDVRHGRVPFCAVVHVARVHLQGEAEVSALSRQCLKLSRQYLGYISARKCLRSVSEVSQKCPGSVSDLVRAGEVRDAVRQAPSVRACHAPQHRCHKVRELAARMEPSSLVGEPAMHSAHQRNPTQD